MLSSYLITYLVIFCIVFACLLFTGNFKKEIRKHSTPLLFMLPFLITLMFIPISGLFGTYVTENPEKYQWIDVYGEKQPVIYDNINPIYLIENFNSETYRFTVSDDLNMAVVIADKNNIDIIEADGVKSYYIPIVRKEFDRKSGNWFIRNYYVIPIVLGENSFPSSGKLIISSKDMVQRVKYDLVVNE